MRFKATAWRNQQGQWLQYSDRTTHTGVHITVSYTDNIDNASLLNYLPSALRRSPEGKELERIEVNVTHFVRQQTTDANRRIGI